MLIKSSATENQSKIHKKYSEKPYPLQALTTKHYPAKETYPVTLDAKKTLSKNLVTVVKVSTDKKANNGKLKL